MSKEVTTTKILVALTDEQLDALQQERRRRGCTRVRLIREAIDAFLFGHGHPRMGGCS